MHDGIDIRAHFIYQKMHRNFARRFSLAFDLVAPSIENDHVLRLDESLIANGRRAHDIAVRQTRADIAIR